MVREPYLPGSYHLQKSVAYVQYILYDIYMFVVHWFDFGLLWSPTYPYDFFAHILYDCINCIVFIVFLQSTLGPSVHIEVVSTLDIIIVLHQSNNREV